MQRTVLLVHNYRVSHLSVFLSARKVYCGKMADWIRVPFGVVSRVGREMGVLDGSDDRGKGRGSFGVNLGVPL